MLFFFFNDTATTEIYTLSLHDALPICRGADHLHDSRHGGHGRISRRREPRSEEHTSELQSRLHLVCRLLLEKKKQQELSHADECGHGAYAVTRQTTGDVVAHDRPDENG